MRNAIDRGLDELSISQVAKLSGLTTGAIYGRFEDHDEMAIELWQSVVKLPFKARLQRDVEYLNPRQHDAQSREKSDLPEAEQIELVKRDLESPDEIAKWFRGCARFLANEIGAAVVLLDHVVKSREQSRNSDFASGSHRKRAAVNGSAYFLDVVLAPSRDSDGSFKLFTRKCRFGWRKHGSIACEVSMKNKVDFQIDFDVKAVAGVQRTASGKPMFTWYMEKVSEFLESVTEPTSKTKIVAGVKKNERLTTTAIATLVEEGYCKIQPGLRGAHLVTSIKPYRQNTDKPIDDPAINPF